MTGIFPNLEMGLAVGIGGAADLKKIELGDVVFGSPRLLSYVVTDQGIRVGSTDYAPLRLRTTLAAMKADCEESGYRMLGTDFEALFRDNVHLREYCLPSWPTDRLSSLKDTRPNDAPESSTANRKALAALKPKMHYGTIASGQGRFENARQREEFAEKHKILCFATGTAEITVSFPIMVIRGIGDFGAPHETADWQAYAAVTAAAGAKRLLGNMATWRSAEQSQPGQAGSASKIVLIRPGGGLTSYTLFWDGGL